jgi:hypothetical protein
MELCDFVEEWPRADMADEAAQVVGLPPPHLLLRVRLEYLMAEGARMHKRSPVKRAVSPVMVDHIAALFQARQTDIALEVPRVVKSMQGLYRAPDDRLLAFRTDGALAFTGGAQVDAPDEFSVARRESRAALEAVEAGRVDCICETKRANDFVARGNRQPTHGAVPRLPQAQAGLAVETASRNDPRRRGERARARFALEAGGVEAQAIENVARAIEDAIARGAFVGERLHVGKPERRIGA